MNCNSCGSDIKAEWIFCPSCAAELKNSAQGDGSGRIVCSSCGESNPAGNTFCSGCGSHLNLAGKDSLKISKPVGASQRPKSKAQNRGVQNKKVSEKDEKAFPLQFLLYFVGALIVLGGIILYTSGAFDSKSAAQSTQAAEEHDHAGNVPDLSKITEINELEKRVEANPADTTALLTLAHMLNDSGFWDKAIERYKQYLKINRNNPEVIIDMGVCFFNSKNYSVADSLMKSALKISPGHVIGLFNLGIISLNQNKTEEARKWFTAVIEKHPASPQAAEAKKLLESHL